MNENVPHAQHIYQMLLSYVILLVHVALQGREYIALLEQNLSTFALYFQQGLVGVAILVC